MLTKPDKSHDKPPDVFTAEETLAQINARGPLFDENYQPIDMATFRGLVLAIACCQPQGYNERPDTQTAIRDQDSNIVSYKTHRHVDAEGNRLKEDKPYDADEQALRHKLETTVNRQIRLCHTANRWAF